MFGEPMEEFDLVRCPTLPYELPLSAVAGALERCEIGRFGGILAAVVPLPDKGVSVSGV
jgi:hypothetical protein